MSALRFRVFLVYWAPVSCGHVACGKPALEWIMEQYRVTVDKKSGIRNDPNDWCREHDNPYYIINLLKRITRFLVETNRIVATLPALNETNSTQSVS